MNELFPYEQEMNLRLNDVPVPDINRAWDDMKRRLKEDDDDRILPFWMRGCGLWLAIGIVAAVFTWVIFSPSRHASTIIARPGNDRGLVQDKTAIPPGTAREVETKKTILLHTDKEQKSSNRGNTTGNGEPASKKNRILNTKTRPRAKASHNLLTAKDRPLSHTAAISAAPDKKDIMTTDQRMDTAGLAEKNANDADTGLKRLPGQKDSDSTQTTKSASIKETATNRKHTIEISAGMALHQLLPVDGQSFNPYNAQGRKNSLSDYIPSLYARVYRNQKWFLQGEFRYGAPQTVKEIKYKEKAVVDTGTRTSVTTDARLKKTFYHQLPVSFNYYLLPHWSIGTGVVWNRFASAISEIDVTQRRLLTGVDSIISKDLVMKNNRADSNFVKSYLQALVETQYSIGRFSIGARYAFGLQPYLRFTLPGAARQEEKNRSLQIFIRYEVWHSKKKQQP